MLLTVVLGETYPTCVELETLHLRAVDERGVRCRELLPRAPHDARLRGVELTEPPLQDAAPFEIGAIEPAAERIEDQKLDALSDLLRNRVVFETRNKFGDTARVSVIGLLERHVPFLCQKQSASR